MIKLYPLLREADKSHYLTWRFLFTGQSPINFWRQWDDFSLDRAMAVSLQDTSRDLQTATQALNWFLRSICMSPKNLSKKCVKKFFTSPNPGETWVVHGDTLSTLLGSLWAKRMKGVIAHIEAGLRSKYILRPFPEEINRRLVSRLVRLHFPQDEIASSNLIAQAVKGDVINTFGNTLYDALDVLGESDSGDPLPDSPFVVANIHRNENLSNQARWECILDTLCWAARDQPVYLVMHPPTEFKLSIDTVASERLRAAGVISVPRVKFRHFIKLIHKSRYVISDGGSNQEECAYLGKPCLILREESERVEGLNESCLLTEFRVDRIQSFLNSPERYARAKTVFKKTPSSIIIRRLEEASYKGVSQ